MSFRGYESEVEVLGHGDGELLISDGDVEVWIPYEHIDVDSEINEDSCEGDTGVIMIPDWLAEDTGLI
jgi:hypothetical protein